MKTLNTLRCINSHLELNTCFQKSNQMISQFCYIFPVSKVERNNTFRKKYQILGIYLNVLGMNNNNLKQH